METGIVVDTDIIIDYLKKRNPGAAFLKEAYLKYRIHITSITVYELLYGVQKSGMDIGVKDSFIAGICESHNMPLLTRNINHFKRIPSIKLIVIK